MIPRLLPVVSVVLAAITPTLAEARAPEDLLAGMSTEEKVGQLFVGHFYGSDASKPDPQAAKLNREIYGVDTPKEAIEKYHLGGVIYFRFTNNIVDAPQVAQLSNELQRGALAGRSPVGLQIAIDQEGGYVSRLPFATEFPGAMALAATRSRKASCDAARITGQELAALGINQNFAPVADVNSNQDNPVIGVRSFGDDVSLVDATVANQVRCFHRAGVGTAVKHFPGHGDTATDSHTGLPTVERSKDSWMEIDRPPFRSAIAAGADAVMTAHVSVPSLDPSGDPATLSKPILTDVLRKRLRYRRVIITDALNMDGVRKKYGDDKIPVLALNAGADQLLMPPNMEVAYKAVIDALSTGEISQQKLDQSVLRILKLKQARGLLPNTKEEFSYAQGEKARLDVGSTESRKVAQEIADQAITVTHSSLHPILRPGARVLITGWEATNAILVEKLLANGVKATGVTTADRPSTQAIAEATKAAGEADVIVAFSSRATKSSEQRDLIAKLMATGKPVVLVALREPYDLAYFPGITAGIATYSNTGVALDSLARLLVGKLSARGKLPVQLP